MIARDGSVAINMATAPWQRDRHRIYPVALPLVVTEHPDLDQPVRLEAVPGELAQLGKYSIAAVGLEVTSPGGEEPTRYVLTVANFNKLASDRPHGRGPADAEPVVPKRCSHTTTKNGGPLNDHNTLEWAGTPQKGKIGGEEARLAREHLDEINARLETQGLRTIDPTNPEHAKRYGFDTASAPNTGQ